MNRTELITEVYRALPAKLQKKISHPTVKAVIDETFDTIMTATLMGDPVIVKNFGTFDPTLRPPHMSYGGKGRERKLSRPYIRILFRSSKAWRRALAAVLEQKMNRKRSSDDDDTETRVRPGGEGRGCEASI